MSIMDKVKGMFGGAKEKIGEAAGNDDLAASGKADRLKADVSDKADSAKDKAAGAVQDAKDKLSD